DLSPVGESKHSDFSSQRAGVSRRFEDRLDYGKGFDEGATRDQNPRQSCPQKRGALVGAKVDERRFKESSRRRGIAAPTEKPRFSVSHGDAYFLVRRVAFVDHGQCFIVLAEN